MPNCYVKTHTCNPVDGNVHKNRSSGRKVNVDKPWFDNGRYFKLKEYRKALFLFNKKYANLMNAKAVYKKLINKRKREYGRYEGNNINFMRKYNPKMFYKLFAKPKSKGSNSNISMTEFLEHFKKLNESHGILDDSVQESDIDSNAVYEELDESVELSEVMEAIKKLNCNKINAEDCIIN